MPGRVPQRTEERRVARPRQFTSADAEQYVHALSRRAEVDFGVYRRTIRPNIQWAWFVEELAREAEKFYDDLISGRRPITALLTPPQHGKSDFAIDFASWTAGKNPDLKTIYASYSDELGTRANRALQRTLCSDAFAKIFPLRIGAQGWAANSNLVEFAGSEGSFRNVTVAGGVTGFRLDLGIIDDPFKGRAEARASRFVTMPSHLVRRSTHFAARPAHLPRRRFSRVECQTGRPGVGGLWDYASSPV